MPVATIGQMSGNIVYDKPYSKKYRNTGTEQKVHLSDSTMLVQAKVLMNVLADEYVVVFGVAQEGETVSESNDKITKRIDNFISEIKKLGISSKDYYVDFITQNRVYEYEKTGNTVYEKEAGFVLKKNISIHFIDKKLIDNITIIASKHEIYDLIKVDYIVLDIPKIKKRLFEEAIKIIKSKKDMYVSQMNVQLLSASRVYYEKHTSYYPSDLYQSFTAFETGKVKTDYYSKTTTVNKRKMKTFYFSPVQSGFDLVINPVIIEPVIQFSYMLEMKYEIKRK